MRYLAKIVILFISVCINSGYSFSQVRTENDIKNLINKCKENKPKALSSVWRNDMAKGKEVSFRNNIQKIDTTHVEHVLLDVFDDVVVSSKMPNCYFVVIENAIGVYDLSGSLIVPPIQGKLLLGHDLLCLGEVTTQKEFDDWMALARSGVVKPSDIKCWLMGTFLCVINSKDLSPVVPYGKFDEIHFTYKGGGENFFAVAKIVDDNKKWGVLTMTGDEILPCEYRSFYIENKQFAGNNSSDMDDMFAKKKEQLTYKRDNRKHPLQQFGSFLAKVFVAIGNGIVAADQFMNDSGGYAFINNLASVYDQSSDYSPSNTHVDGGSLRSAESVKSGGMSLSDAQNYQSLRNTYRKWADDLRQMKNANGHYSNGYSLPDKKHAQSEMKRIRQAAKSRYGKELPYDSIEDW